MYETIVHWLVILACKSGSQTRYISHSIWCFAFLQIHSQRLRTFVHHLWKYDRRTIMTKIYVYWHFYVNLIWTSIFYSTSILFQGDVVIATDTYECIFHHQFMYWVSSALSVFYSRAWTHVEHTSCRNLKIGTIVKSFFVCSMEFLVFWRANMCRQRYLYHSDENSCKRNRQQCSDNITNEKWLVNHPGMLRCTMLKQHTVTSFTLIDGSRT